MEDYKKSFKEGLDKAAEFLKKSSEEVGSKLKEGVEKISQIGPAAVDKAADLVNDLIAIMPLLEEAGYPVQSFSVCLALSPMIEVSFLMGHEIEAEKLEALKKEHEDKRLFNMILGTLKVARDLAAKIDDEDYTFEETVVEITMPPKVNLRYINRRSAATEMFKLERE
jgi:hypothetical protein